MLDFLSFSFLKIFVFELLDTKDQQRGNLQVPDAPYLAFCPQHDWEKRACKAVKVYHVNKVSYA